MEDLNKESVRYKLLAETIITEDGHYLYQGCLNQAGYGVKMIGRVTYGVHRLGAYIFHNLDLENKETLALHKNSCLYKNCWSENCIYVGTHKDNMKDIKNKNGDKFRCGHLKEETKIWMDSEKRWKCKVCNYAKGRINKRKYQKNKREIKDVKQKYYRDHRKWILSKSINTNPTPLVNPFKQTKEKQQ